MYTGTLNVRMKGKPGCCGNPQYKQEGCEKIQEVRANIDVSFASNHLSSSNMICMNKDPLAGTTKYMRDKTNTPKDISGGYCQVRPLCSLMVPV